MAIAGFRGWANPEWYMESGQSTLREYADPEPKKVNPKNVTGMAPMNEEQLGGPPIITSGTAGEN